LEAQMRTISVVAAALAVVFGSGLTAHAQTNRSKTVPQAVRVLPPPDSAGQPTVGSTAYKIGAQDTVEIDVFQIPDLSKTTQVDAAGNVRLPLLGDVQAAGRTPSELAAFVQTELARTYVKDPKVSVTVKESSSRRVTVDGAVVQPGIYALSGPTTLLQAVALARGPDPREANLKKVAIFRQISGQRQAAVFDLSAIRSGAVADPQVYPDDVVVVEASRGRSFLRDLSGALPILSIFRPF